jgi:hypothetical protein
MTFRPRVLRAVLDQELRWLGRVVLPGIFDGVQFSKIEPLDEGRRTRFIQGERFTGRLPLLRVRTFQIGISWTLTLNG